MVEVIENFATKSEASAYARYARKEMPRGVISKDGTKLESVRVVKAPKSQIRKFGAWNVVLVFRYGLKPNTRKGHKKGVRYGLFGA